MSARRILKILFIFFSSITMIYELSISELRHANVQSKTNFVSDNQSNTLTESASANAEPTTSRIETDTRVPVAFTKVWTYVVSSQGPLNVSSAEANDALQSEYKVAYQQLADYIVVLNRADARFSAEISAKNFSILFPSLVASQPNADKSHNFLTRYIVDLLYGKRRTATLAPS